MIELVHPPYATFHRLGTYHHFNLFIPNGETEYFGICQQVDAQILGWTE